MAWSGHFALLQLLPAPIATLTLAGLPLPLKLPPPIDRLVDRDSETMGVERFEYGPVEIAEEVGWEAFRKVADGICELFHRTGLFHGYSMNWWSDHRFL
jgi:hypothetical protein